MTDTPSADQQRTEPAPRTAADARERIIEVGEGRSQPNASTLFGNESVPAHLLSKPGQSSLPLVFSCESASAGCLERGRVVQRLESGLEVSFLIPDHLAKVQALQAKFTPPLAFNLAGLSVFETVMSAVTLAFHKFIIHGSVYDVK
jgi:hypothetical protein